jgi:hypothetical protein
MIKKKIGDPVPKKKGGDPVKKETGPVKEGYTMPEFTKTASRIVDKPAKPAKAKDWTRKVSSVNKAALKRSGAGAKKVTNILGMKKRF